MSTIEIPAETIDRMLLRSATAVLERHQPYPSPLPGHPSRLCQQCGQCGQEITHPCQPYQRAQRAVHLAGGVS